MTFNIRAVFRKREPNLEKEASIRLGFGKRDSLTGNFFERLSWGFEEDSTGAKVLTWISNEVNDLGGIGGIIGWIYTLFMAGLVLISLVLMPLAFIYWLLEMIGIV